MSAAVVIKGYGYPGLCECHECRIQGCRQDIGLGRKYPGQRGTGLISPRRGPQPLVTREMSRYRILRDQILRSNFFINADFAAIIEHRTLTSGADLLNFCHRFTEGRFDSALSIPAALISAHSARSVDRLSWKLKRSTKLSVCFSSIRPGRLLVNSHRLAFTRCFSTCHFSTHHKEHVLTKPFHPLLFNSSTRKYNIRQMHVFVLPMRWGSGDNYCYVVKDDATKEAAVIDPAFPQEIVPSLRRLASSGEIELTSIVNTHHHYDHSGGNTVLHSFYPDLPIYAGKDSPIVTRVLDDGEYYRIGENLTLKALHTPCHTQDSICWLAEDKKTGEQALFSGDTLFNVGCGRFFEGDANQMLASFTHLRREVKTDAKLFSGHEYTKSNVDFALQVEPENEALKRIAEFCRKNEQITGKFTLGDEMEYNPFLRTDKQAVQRRLKTSSSVATLAKLRSAKDRGKLEEV